MNTEDKLKQMMAAARAEESVTQAEWTNFVERAHRPLYMRRAAAAVGALALIGLGVFGATALLAEDARVRPLPPATTPTPTAESTPTPDAPTTVEVPPAERELWFVQGEILQWNPLTAGGPIPIEVASDDPVAQQAAFVFDMLLVGPQGPSAEAGDTTAIPEDTELLHVARDGSALEVDLSSEFTSGGGSLAMQMRVAQVVFTGTQFQGIDSVRILIEGEPVDGIGGEGVPAGGVRRDFQNVAPAIVPETPKPGEEISGSVTVSGFANTFEANVVIQIHDANGNQLIETFTTATCGSGCWGDFSDDVSFEVTERQEGYVTVLTYSAEDGSERDRIQIPVTLLP